MTEPGFSLFDTAIARCGIAWNGHGIVGVQLPEYSDPGTRARIRRRCPEAHERCPPPDVQHAIDAIVALLNGEMRDLAGIMLDMDRVSAFERRVYEVARTIVPGDTMTYGEIAVRLGSSGTAREVGQALGRNPFAIIVPCHRVIATGGKTGGFSANGGVATKLRMLQIESVHAEGTLFHAARSSVS